MMKWFVVLSVLIGTVVGDRSLANAQSAAAAIKEAQRTGWPIFAVAGATYCPHCVTLMRRLNTEERLQPLIANFVPLKLDVSSRDFKAWEKFFPRRQSAIPALYIVTPQGRTTVRQARFVADRETGKGDDRFADQSGKISIRRCVERA